MLEALRTDRQDTVHHCCQAKECVVSGAGFQVAVCHSWSTEVVPSGDDAKSPGQIFGLQSCYPSDAKVVWLQLSDAVKQLFVHLMPWHIPDISDRTPAAYPGLHATVW